MDRRRLANGHEYSVGKRRGSGEDSPTTRAGKVRLRSISDLDGRTHAAQRARQLVADLEADLGGGDRLPVAVRQLVQRAALLSVILEDHECRWLTRQPADLRTYGTLVDRQRRVLEALGLGRVPRDVSPDATGRIVEAIRAGAA